MCRRTNQGSPRVRRASQRPAGLQVQVTVAVALPIVMSMQAEYFMSTEGVAVQASMERAIRLACQAGVKPSDEE
jgi:hypothetical protein